MKHFLNPYTIILAGLIAVGSLLYHLGAPGSLTATQPDSSHGSGGSANPNRVECTGFLRSDRCYAVFLRPGEWVVDILVREGQRVARDTPLVHLANDALLREAATLEERELTVKQEQHKGARLELEIDQVTRHIRHLEQQITKERELARKIPEYRAEKRLQEWTELLQQQNNRLALLSLELDQLRSRAKSREQLMGLLVERRNTLEDELSRLNITAPFAGKVIQLHSGGRRPAPNDQILELCQEDSLVVVVNVWQHQIPYIKPGLRARVFPDFFHTRMVMGTVRAIGRAQQSGAADSFPVFPVEIALDRLEPGMLAGMSVAVEIMLGEMGQGS